MRATTGKQQTGFGGSYTCLRSGLALLTALSIALPAVMAEAPLMPVMDELWLDSHSLQSPDMAGPVEGDMALEEGVLHRIEVQGTFSPWAANHWWDICAGVAETAPLFPSPGVINGIVGLDAAFVFSWPPSSASLCPGGTPSMDPPLPSRALEFSLDGGLSWFKPEPLNPELNVDHIYAYEVVGAGLPLHARLVNGRPGDDYGQLAVVVLDPVSNEPPVCTLGAPRVVPCSGDVTSVRLDASGATDADGDPLTFLWSVDCEGASFDDPTSPTPVLQIESAYFCTFECAISVEVSDGLEVTSCSTLVTVEDDSPPNIVSAAVLALEEGQLRIEFEAVDACNAVTATGTLRLPSGVLDVVDGQVILVGCEDIQSMRETPGQSVLTVTATDACGNTAIEEVTVEIDTSWCPPPGETGAPFLRGDSDANGIVNLGDVLHAAHHVLGRRSAGPCQDAMDSDDDGLLTLGDPIYLMVFLYLGGPPVPPPYPEPGPDPTPDALDCNEYPGVSNGHGERIYRLLRHPARKSATRSHGKRAGSARWR